MLGPVGVVVAFVLCAPCTQLGEVGLGMCEIGSVEGCIRIACSSCWSCAALNPPFTSVYTFLIFPSLLCAYIGAWGSKGLYTLPVYVGVVLVLAHNHPPSSPSSFVRLCAWLVGVVLRFWRSLGWVGIVAAVVYAGRWSFSLCWLSAPPSPQSFVVKANNQTAHGAVRQAALASVGRVIWWSLFGRNLSNSEVCLSGMILTLEGSAKEVRVDVRRELRESGWQYGIGTNTISSNPLLHPLLSYEHDHTMAAPNPNHTEQHPNTHAHTQRDPTRNEQLNLGKSPRCP
ncbi:hypothetical protein BDQ17DRAFT_1323604 [Cyathus striatus]|nr:hypothetical protein BDQ17DRAFT_1323604 [Cyathus striatus]